MTRAQTKNDAEPAPHASEPSDASSRPEANAATRGASAPPSPARAPEGASAASQPPPSVPELILAGSRFARYEIVRCIGVGGMGAVFEATHTLLRKRVALKAMHTTLGRSESSRARFLREAETVARISHPHVVDISDVGVERGIPFLVMEYLEGEDLASLLEREGRLFVQRAIDLALPLVAGMSAVHRLGIVHRDIKPENVFLAVNALGDMVPKLVDFGVSKDIEAGGPKTAPMRHTVAGTPYYMAPEQARGSSVLDGRADQYAVGVLLYQCLAGVRPYESESLLELIHLIDAGSYAPLAQHCPELPGELLAVIERAMSRRIEDRFESSEAFGQALLPFASEQVRNVHAREFTLERRSASQPRELAPEMLARLSAETVASETDTTPPLTPVTASVVPRRSVSGVRARDTEPSVVARPSIRTRSRRAFVLAAAVTGVLLLGGYLLWSNVANKTASGPVVTVEPPARPKPPAPPEVDPGGPKQPVVPPSGRAAGGSQADSARDKPLEPEVHPTRRTGRPKRSEEDAKPSPVDIQLSR